MQKYDILPYISRGYLHEFLIKKFTDWAQLDYNGNMEQALSQSLTHKMRMGKVYRRADLAPYSNAVDRELKALCESKAVLKLSSGLYYRPKQSAFGNQPPEDEVLVSSFLKDSRFLLTSFNHFNSLGLGLTQLYNTQVVYNYKRHGRFVLGSKTFEFKRVSNFPKKLSKEFLVVDLLNNLKNLAEDPKQVQEQIKAKLSKFCRDTLLNMANQYGRARTRHFLQDLLSKRP